jgi:hypothetical protein
VETLDAPKPIEHGSTKGGRWLRARRFRIAAWIAVGEGLLVVLHVVPRWPAIFLAALVIALYAFVGRNVKNDTIRQVSWVAAASQALMILVPIFVALFATVAIVLLVVIAVVALLVLFTDRD